MESQIESRTGRIGRSQPQRRASRLLTSPVLFGLLGTVLFYFALPHLPIRREMAVRYFCGHPLEYVSTALFFVGIALLVGKRWQLSRERRAFDRTLFETAAVAATDDPLERAHRLHEAVESQPRTLRETWLGRRILDCCEHVLARQSAASLEEHLRYLGELAGERMQASYGPVRTIIWAVPILGFLGTVIGITLAIANVTPDQLDTSLSEVTGGLAVAFDTTALALALSLLLVFASFTVERGEQVLLAEVEDYGVQNLIPLFPDDSSEGSPFPEIERQAAERLRKHSESFLKRQSEMWEASLERFRERWIATLENQTQSLDAALAGQTRNSLDQHAVTLRTSQAAFLNAVQEVSESLQGSLSSLREQLETFACVSRDERQAAAEQLVQMRTQAEALTLIGEGMQHRAAVDEQLTEGMQAFQRDSGEIAESLQQTLHGLTAAVHLLTAKVPADRAA